MISNDAVEAATKAIDTCGCESPEWLARLALEAAAPHMLAEAWEAGLAAAILDQYHAPNPYRSAK